MGVDLAKVDLVCAPRKLYGCINWQNVSEIFIVNYSSHQYGKVCKSQGMLRVY